MYFYISSDGIKPHLFFFIYGLTSLVRIIFASHYCTVATLSAAVCCCSVCSAVCINHHTYHRHHCVHRPFFNNPKTVPCTKYKIQYHKILFYLHP